MKNKQLRLTTMAAALALASVVSISAHAAPTTADIVFIVDESGSMSGEHAWLGTMVGSLDTGLVGAGVTANNYGLTGFGSSTVAPHEHLVGGASFGTAAQLSTATGGLLTNGSTEDGWAGIDFANSNYTFNSGAARNFVLVTDEDRDNTAVLTYAGILASMTGPGTLLNAVVNASFYCGGVPGQGGIQVLGISSGGSGYQADGSGGYNTLTNCSAFSGAGTTIADYVNLALATGGAAWDLNQLRAGGLTADSFTAAFVDIKVQEITTQVPLPGTLALMGAALLGLFGVSRRKTA